MNPCPLSTMKPSITWLSLGVIALVLSACTTPKPKPKPPPTPREAPEPGPVQDPDLGLRVTVGNISLQILKDWRLRPDTPLAWEAPTTIGVPPDGATMNVIIGDTRPTTVPWDAHWDTLAQEYKTRTTAVQQILEEGPLKIEGAQSAWFFIIQRTEQGQTFKLFQVLVGTRQHIYYLTYGVSAEAFPRYRDLFTRSAASVWPENNNPH